ncbi:MAG: hypothetical protein UT41_C0001G0284 [Candidatus Wolfebacteria bacterium GW2011_GWC2_39_22]|uniref:Uncharacterized protein n=1 Tax=Candidatus Wolfebacteria bacterium GW2011_GWC2_39_22 TaxID=1619013 RepID=A0A0G0QQU1_9BACT|nr:MAG: hypothetical protein UT41_C0001G0284 [Candidatus Wolfebacteria bacterium GW2011_GWC2_39_22]
MGLFSPMALYKREPFLEFDGVTDYSITTFLKYKN